MSLNDVQNSIAQWARNTFGRPDPKRIGTRMNVEVAELLIALDNLPPAGFDREEAINRIGMECADVFIMLVQIPAALGTDLESLVAEKMKINRTRTWGRDDSGMTQHVETKPTPKSFLEEGSGAMLFPDKWYLLWDAGGLVLKEGFPTAEEAYEAAQRAGYARGLVIPDFVSWNEGWKNTGHINVMYGEHLKLWWANRPREEKRA